MKHDTNGQIVGNATVVPGKVENGAGKPRHRREGRRLSEPEVTELNPVAERSVILQCPSLR
jgi:hypothetical protein